MDTGKASWLTSQHSVNAVREQWFSLAGKYSSDHELIQKLFSEIESSYGVPNRHYHNVRHIDTLLYLSNQYQSDLQDKDVVDFSIFYHDLIYKVTRSDNEKKSAATAAKRLSELNLSPGKIADIVQYITATKSHQLNGGLPGSDLAWFLDFDMSILAVEWDKYLEYTRQVRREYAIYPDFIYNQGRKKFLQQSLSSPYIFHTSLFRQYHELDARENMKRELEAL